MILKEYPERCLENCEKYIGSFECLAFPDGIPDAILTGEHDHREPYPGDNGIRFEPIQDTNA